MLLYFFWFFIIYLPKKMETEKWPKVADSPLLYFIHDKYYKNSSLSDWYYNTILPFDMFFNIFIL